MYIIMAVSLSVLLFVSYDSLSYSVIYLLISTIQTAFYEGILNEYEVCKRLNIKPDKLDKYIQ